MKEFWLQPDKKLSEDAIRKLLQESKPHTLILENLISSLPTKIASQEKGGDILITPHVDELVSAKENHVAVALEVSIHDRKDYDFVLRALDHSPDYLLIDCPNWKVIPLENLVAGARGEARLIARTRNFEESKTALNVLEVGADGIALACSEIGEILKTRDLVSNYSDELTLSTARIQSVKPIGSGARVCIDTCEILNPGEGLLTGSSSQGLFLVEGEVHSNPHVNTRPFRVNAGPVSMYVLGPEGKTRYLSEIATGETVLAVDRNGKTRKLDVARVKIERRPMLLLEANAGSKSVRTIVQNAETVHLVTQRGSKPVSEIKPGDEVLVRVEQGGRHFGMKVEEELIIER